MIDLVWEPAYNIGIEDIDLQHMDFIKLLRRFKIAIEKKLPPNVQQRMLNELVKYADYHFASEENIMFIARYPNLSIQEAEHSVLLKLLRQRTESFAQGREKGEDLLQYLYGWFINHTQKEDRKITAHFAKPTPPEPAAS